MQNWDTHGLTDSIEATNYIYKCQMYLNLEQPKYEVCLFFSGFISRKRKRFQFVFVALRNYLRCFRLAEVGKLLPQEATRQYETGQLFLHRVFGYRGAILFPWLSKVYDRDAPTPNTTKSSDAAGDTSPPFKEVQRKTHAFYQVLIDQRDCPYIRAQTEAVTFLGNQDSSRSLYAIPGLDYVAHEDILPYTSQEQAPIQHELFDKFLVQSPEKGAGFKAQDTLLAWQQKNHPWLELSDVHKETTEGIRVTVIPFYMGCRETPASSVYWVRLDFQA